MDKKIAGLLGAVAAVATFSGAQATPAPAPGADDALAARSYADLLNPIPNASEALIADNARLASQPAQGVQLARYHHHHHHHHHRVIVVPRHRYHRYYYHHHHHHHHHHHGVHIGVPGVGVNTR